MEPVMHEWVLSALKVVAGGIGAFFVKWAWDRYWRARDQHDMHESEQLRAVADRIVVAEKKLEAGEVRESERQRTLGKMEGEINRLDGKIEGLQAFWRTKFEKLEERFATGLESIRTEIRADQQAHETRQAGSLEAHQKRVHDRLNEASLAQAQMMNELVDKLVDKAGE